MTRSAWLLLLVAAASCRRHPPAAAPAPAPPPATVAAEPEPAPPPPPTCESPADACTADADTECLLDEAGAWFKPPVGWRYVRKSPGAVTRATDELSVLAFTLASSKEPKAILAALEPLFTELGITKLDSKKLSSRLKKPQSTLEAGGASAEIWEVNPKQQRGAPELGGKPGALLVVVLPLAPERVIVGAGFVVTPEADDRVGAMMHAVESLRGSK